VVRDDAQAEEAVQGVRSTRRVKIEDLKLNALGILAEYTRLKVFADAYCDKMTERRQVLALRGQRQYAGA
jgi:hypothetical protein